MEIAQLRSKYRPNISTTQNNFIVPFDSKKIVLGETRHKFLNEKRNVEYFETKTWKQKNLILNSTTQ